MTESTPPNQSDTSLATSTDDAKLAVWVSPEAVEINLGRAETANTNSNFDGTNYSS